MRRLCLLTAMMAVFAGISAPAWAAGDPNSQGTLVTLDLTHDRDGHLLANTGVAQVSLDSGATWSAPLLNGGQVWVDDSIMIKTGLRDHLTLKTKVWDSRDPATIDSSQTIEATWDGSANQLLQTGTLLVPTFTAAPTGGPGKITVTVLKSGGAPYQGVAISYLDGYWRGAGNTDATGKLTLSPTFPAGSRQVQASIAGTAKIINVTVSGNTDVQFATTLMKMHCLNAAGSALAGVSVSYKPDYDRGIGSSTTDGTPSVELFPTPGKGLKWTGSYGGSSQVQTMDVPGDGSATGSLGDVTFQSKVVTVTVLKHDATTPLPGVSVSYKPDYDRGIGTTNASGQAKCELFGSSGSLPFTASYGGTAATQSVDMSPAAPSCTFYTSCLSASAKKDDGTDLTGVSISYKPDYDRGIGTTPASAEVFPRTGLKVTASYGGTAATTTVDIPGNATLPQTPLAKTGSVTFYTSKVVCKAVGSDGSAIPGVSVSYKPDYDRGIGNTAAPDGSVSCQVFPTTVNFTASYGGTTSTPQSVTVPGTGLTGGQSVTVTFNLTKVTIWFGNGSISYFAGYWRGVPNGSPFYMFSSGSSSYPFSFAAGYQKPTGQAAISIGTSTVSKAACLEEVVDSKGNMLKQDQASQYYLSGWTNATEDLATSGAGKLYVAVFDSASKPGTTTFGVTYGGQRQEKSQNIGTDPLVKFATVPVTLKFLVGGVEDNKSGKASCQYYASGWKTLGDGQPTATMELLPATYAFSCTYGGQRQEKSQNIATDPMVVFGTGKLVVKLLSADGKTELSAPAQYYASGWKDIGNTGTVIDLLPGSYSTAVTYGGMRQEKGGITVLAPTTAEPNPVTTVTYRLGVLEVHLLDYAGTADVSGGTSQYYASGWKNVGGAPASIELLPGTYSVSMDYRGMRQEKGSQQVAEGGLKRVDFQLGRLVVTCNGGWKDGAAAQFYASGWKNMAGTPPTEDLLPGSYSAACTYGGMRQEKGGKTVTSGNTTTVDFSDPVVTVVFKDHNGSPLAGGEVQYYASGWHAVGTTDASGQVKIDLLPGNYTFAVNFGGGRQEQPAQIGEAEATVTFQTGLVTATKYTMYYASGWKGINGSVELLPGSYAIQGVGVPQATMTVAAGATLALQ